MVDPTFQFVLSPYQNAFFHELAEAIVFELIKGGCNAAIVDPAAARCDEDCVFVLLPPHEYVALEGDSWLHDERLLGRTIALMAEQPHQPHFAQNAAIARSTAAAFDFNRQAVSAYRMHRVDARYLSVGYTESWDTFEASPTWTRDVLFLGSEEARRQQLLAQCAGPLSRHRARLIVSDNSSPNTAASPHFVTGRDKRQLLASSKVMLNIHRSSEPYFEWLRFIEAFHCGCTVVSESTLGTEPYAAGRHFISSTPESLPAVLEAALHDENRLLEVRQQAYEQLRAHPFSASLEQLVDVARALTDRPTPTHAPPFTRDRPHPHPHDNELLVDTWSDHSVMRQSLREIRLELQGVRRQIASLQRTVAGEDTQHLPDRSVVCSSPSWRLSGAPRVSVLMAMYNHDEFVEAALDSLIAASVDQPVEVIVVDDGCTDSSASIVQRWIGEHPWFPAALVAHRVNQGLPVARNTATACARGEFAFVLDSDNEVLPGGLDRLVEALDSRPEASMAFGIHEVFTQDGTVGTMGVFPWQPKRLRNGNYIDAMALIRIDALRTLGGYTTDRRLYGWEDYDLWCRLAESGHHGVHVANFVARYRRSATSMVALSNVSSVAAFSALSERYPDLWGKRLDNDEFAAWDPALAASSGGSR